LYFKFTSAKVGVSGGGYGASVGASAGGNSANSNSNSDSNGETKVFSICAVPPTGGDAMSRAAYAISEPKLI